jgi:nucleoside-diphosphate-sugar epimerase
MKFLILGSEGVVGKALCKFFTLQNIEYIPWDIKLGNEYDLRDPSNNEKLMSCMESVDFVMFMSFDVGGSKYLVGQKIDFINNNLMIMVNTFKALEKTGKPFIFASSQMSNMHYCSYGTCKKIGEHYTEHLNGISVQFWNVYGYEEINAKSHVVNDFIDMAITDKKIIMRTDGNEKRQFLYDSDCAEGLYKLAIHFDYYKDTIIHFTFNEWTTIYDTAILIKKVLKEEYDIDIDIQRGVSKDESQKIENMPVNLIKPEHWDPKISLIDGIKMLIDLAK